MVTAEPCPWCMRTEPSMDEPCACHPPDCLCQPCANSRYWAYLEAGPDEWTRTATPTRREP